MNRTNTYSFDVLPVHPRPKQLESLTSYLTRLVAANSMRSVWDLFKLCFPTGRSKLTFSTGDFPPPSFGNLPIITQCPVSTLATTTFLHLGEKFNRRPEPRPLALFLSGSIARHLRYCPQCLIEYGYYSLVWRFIAVKGCPEHNCRLLDRCGHCGQTIPLIASPEFGVCPTCKGNLATCQSERFGSNKQQLVRTRFDDFVYLLSPQIYEQPSEQRLNIIGKQFTGWRRIRQLKIPDIARHLELSPAILYYIEETPKHRGVKFQWYLDYADFLHISFRSVFETTLPEQPILNHEERLVNKIQQAITILDQHDEPVTQATVAQMIGYGTRIFNAYPSIKNLWAEHIINRKRTREKKLAIKVQQTVDCLRKQGIPVNQTIVSRMVGLSREGLRRYSTAWTILEKHSDYHVRKKHQPSNLNSVHQQPPTSKMATSKTRKSHLPRQNEDELIAKVRQALSHLEQHNLLITINAVSKIVGLHPGTLKYYPRVRAVLFEEVTDKAHLHRAKQFRRKEDELVRKVQQAIETLATDEQRMTQTAVCKMVPMSSVNLKRYPRVKLLLQQHGLMKPSR